MFTNTLSARSISQHAAGILRPGAAGRVLASFERVCDLVTDDGAVAALVWDGVGDGPLNILLEHGPGAALPAGTRFTVGCEGKASQSEEVGKDCEPVDLQISLALDLPGNPGGTLRGASSLQIDLTSAIPWNPRPDWGTLQTRRQQIAAGAETIARILADAGVTRARCELPDAVCQAAARGQPSALLRLIGLGPGLTPAGDDWLAGWMLGLHLTPGPTGSERLTDLILDAAVTRTTTLSRALLECAAAGEADSSWHSLLGALADGSSGRRPAIAAAAHVILSHGDTSGAAMLTGFLAGIRVPSSWKCCTNSSTTIGRPTDRGNLCQPSPASRPPNTTTL